MRGKGLSLTEEASNKRITPAHAGKSKSGKLSNGGFKDHPRTCGEKTSESTIFPTVLGSPPHMRGKVLICGVIVAAGRITPAHAGKRFKAFVCRKRY